MAFSGFLEVGEFLWAPTIVINGIIAHIHGLINGYLRLSPL